MQRRRQQTEKNSYNQREIKKYAKETVLKNNNWCNLFLAWFIYNLPVLMGAWILMLVREYSSPAIGRYLILWLLAFFVMATFVMLPFSTAVNSYYLENLRGKKCPMSYINGIARDYYGTYIITMIFLIFATLIWSLLLIVPGVIKGISYLMTPFLLHDNPGLENEAIAVSKRLTKGHRFDLFCLLLSFLPWLLLLVLSVGIASAFVIPYIKMTIAIYYEQLRCEAVEKGVVLADDVGMDSAVVSYVIH